MTEIHHLSFCIVSKLSKCCAEFVVNQGVEVNLDMVFEYHDWLLDNLQSPMFILLNKIFPCTYSFDAQIQLASFKDVKAMAVVVNDKVFQSTTQILQSVPREGDWRIEVFDEREVALSWLNKQREYYSFNETNSAHNSKRTS